MRIEVDTATCRPDDYTALIVLFASLGGRLPAPGSLAEHPHPIVQALYADGTTAPRDPIMPEVRQAAEPTDENENDEGGPADGSIDPTKPDSTGVPWDARIHSTPPKLNKDLSYRSKRGVSEVEFGRIHGELAEAFAAANPTTGTATSGAASQAGGIAGRAGAPPPPADTPGTDDAASTGGNRAPPPPDATESAHTEAPSDNAADATDGSGPKFATFAEFVQTVNGIKAGGIPYLELNMYANTLGVPGGFKDMKDHPDKWVEFYELAGGQ